MWNDVRYSARAFTREPGLAAIAILTLALGVGANTAIFSVVNGVLLRPLGYRQPGSLVVVNEIVPELSHLYPLFPVNARHFQTWVEKCTAFEHLSLVKAGDLNITGSGEPERLKAAVVTWNYFAALGVQPSLGRAFLPAEDQPGAEPVVILSDSLWRRRFGADPYVVGRSVTLGDRSRTVVGVLPPGVAFPRADALERVALDVKVEVYRPMALNWNQFGWQGDHNYGVIGRLNPGRTAAQALAEINVVQADISRQISSEGGSRQVLRAAMAPLAERAVGPVRRSLVVLLAAVGAVLLIVCVNLANLMLARGAARRREAAIRIALGASRSRLVRETLVSSLLMAALGGALGVALAYAGVAALVRHAPIDLPRMEEVRLDPRVLLFALAVSITAGLLAGTLPAWRAAQSEPQHALKSGGRTATEGVRGLRMRDMLVSVEVGLSAVLLILAGLLLASFTRLMHVDKGFDAEKVLSVELPLPPARYQTMDQCMAFTNRLLDKVRVLPGIVAAGVVSALPLQGETWVDGVAPEIQDQPIKVVALANYRFISTGYFEAMHIGLRRGRLLEASDRGKNVVLISERTAERVWPGQNPLGKRFRRGNSKDLVREIIGVVQDTRVAMQKEPVLTVYVPQWAITRETIRPILVMRTVVDPHSLVAAVRAAVRSADPEVPIPAMKTMDDIVEASVAQRRFQMLLTSLFAGAAMLLASLGIYGVVSYSVARRTNEMGIRMALGAGAGDLRRMVLRQGMFPVWIGLAAGLFVALSLGRLVSSLLYGVKATDPLTFAVVAATLAIAAALACYLPARRATRIDPLAALRYE